MEREGDINLDHLSLSNTLILCTLDACNPALYFHFHSVVANSRWRRFCVFFSQISH